MSTLSERSSLISTGYVLLFVLSAALVLWLIPSRRWKAVTLLMLSTAFAYPLAVAEMAERSRLARNQMIAERFMKLCKEKAGEKIYKTVAGVRGLLIMRPRKPTTSLQEYLDQNWTGDPYGHSDLEAENPEQVFLFDRPSFDGVTTKISQIPGYDFIELPAPTDAHEQLAYVRIEAARRYTDSHRQQRIEYSKTQIAALQSRYGYDWLDISTPEDRKYWTAGGRMRIIDLQTNTIIAERVGYVIDIEQGARLGGGIPWLIAQKHACPAFESESTKSKEFISKVLKPARASRE